MASQIVGEDPLRAARAEQVEGEVDARTEPAVDGACGPSFSANGPRHGVGHHDQGQWVEGPVRKPWAARRAGTRCRARPGLGCSRPRGRGRGLLFLRGAAPKNGAGAKGSIPWGGGSRNDRAMSSGTNPAGGVRSVNSKPRRGEPNTAVVMVPAGGSLSGFADLRSKMGHGSAPPQDLDADVHGAVGDGRHEGRVEGPEALAVIAQLRSHRAHRRCRNHPALGMGYQRPRLVYHPLVPARLRMARVRDTVASAKGLPIPEC